ncbi:MAG: glycosyltransferase family 2 protein [Candidatus Delongbacteria bacterium]|nr:glycosyltransferase family 2 protein [Candidatus Delongbacteria bacterium]MBN2836853.1 glycosyltransferase family 2 protein [Candidatus Delongbacteria bacterium]
MKNDLISVVIANYNNSKFLPQCIESVLKQSYKNFEIIIVDDCSTDDSLRVLEEYSEKFKNIRVFQNTKNSGVTKTRHSAILNSKGKYITTLDADDYYYSDDKLEKEYSHLISMKSKSIKPVITYSDIAIVDFEGKFIKNWYDDQILPEGDILENIFFRNCVIPRDFLFERELYFEVGGYDLDVPIYEDYDLDIRLAKKCQFYFSGTIGTAYRQNPNGLSKAKMIKHYFWIIKIVNKNKKLIKGYKKIYSYLYRLYLNIIIYYIKKNKFLDFLYNRVKKSLKFY